MALSCPRSAPVTITKGATVVCGRFLVTEWTLCLPGKWLWCSPDPMSLALQSNETVRLWSVSSSVLAQLGLMRGLRSYVGRLFHETFVTEFPKLSISSKVLYLVVNGRFTKRRTVQAFIDLAVDHLNAGRDFLLSAKELATAESTGPRTSPSVSDTFSLVVSKF